MTERLETKADVCNCIEWCKYFDINCSDKNYKTCKLWDLYNKKGEAKKTFGVSYFPIQR